MVLNSGSELHGLSCLHYMFHSGFVGIFPTAKFKKISKLTVPFLKVAGDFYAKLPALLGPCSSLVCRVEDRTYFRRARCNEQDLY